MLVILMTNSENPKCIQQKSLRFVCVRECVCNIIYDELDISDIYMYTITMRSERESVQQNVINIVDTLTKYHVAFTCLSCLS